MPKNKKEVKNNNKKDKKENNKNKKSFFKDFKAELKRVTWPTPKQLVNNTVAVITIVLITAAIVFVLDLAFESLNKYGVDKVKEAITQIDEQSTNNTTTDTNTTSENSTQTDENATSEDNTTTDENTPTEENTSSETTEGEANTENVTENNAE